MFHANDELLECSGRSADQSTSSSSCETMSLLETSITNFRTLVSYIRLLFLFCYKHWKVSLILATIFTLSIYVIGVWATLLLLLLFLLCKCLISSVFFALFNLVLFLPVDNLYTACDALLYNPNLPKDSRTNVLTPKSYDLDYERHMLETEDKVNIHVQLIKRTKTEESVSAPTIIYLHGNAGNIGHRLVNAIELYRAIKCNIVLMEYRGFGLSEGKPTEKGLYKDVCATLAFLNKRNDICKSKVILFGRSLGGAVAIGTVHKILTMANSEELIHPAALIIENTFTSVPDISRFLFTGNSRSCFARLFRIVPDWFYKSRYNSIGKISKISLPTLFLSGLSDELIPQSMMSRLYNVNLVNLFFKKIIISIFYF